MTKLEPITCEELMSRRFPEDAWLVKNLIPQGCITVMAGYPGSFKTFLLMDLAICLATGNKFLGEFEVSKTKVLFIDEENGEKILQRRIKKLTKEQNLDFEIISLSGFKLKDSDNIISYCIKNKIEVIVMDSLIRIHSGDENSSSDMAKLFDEFKKFKVNNLSVIFAHHNRKTGQNRANPTEDMRGSSEIFAFVDAGLSVKKENNGKEIKITPIKLRIDEEAKPFIVTVTDEENCVSFNYNGVTEEKNKLSKPEQAKELITSLLNEENNNELYQKEIVDLLKNKVGESAIKIAIKDMLANSLIKSRRGEGNAQYYSLIKSGESITS